jgi:hypothetical protein
MRKHVENQRISACGTFSLPDPPCIPPFRLFGKTPTIDAFADRVTPEKPA